MNGGEISRLGQLSGDRQTKPMGSALCACGGTPHGALVHAFRFRLPLSAEVRLGGCIGDADVVFAIAASGVPMALKEEVHDPGSSIRDFIAIETLVAGVDLLPAEVFDEQL